MLYSIPKRRRRGCRRCKAREAAVGASRSADPCRRRFRAGRKNRVLPSVEASRDYCVKVKGFPCLRGAATRNLSGTAGIETSFKTRLKEPFFEAGLFYF